MSEIDLIHVIPANSSMVEKEDIGNNPPQVNMEGTNQQLIKQLLKNLYHDVPETTREIHVIDGRSQAAFRDNSSSIPTEKYKKLKKKVKDMEYKMKEKLENQFEDQKMKEQTRDLTDIVKKEIDSLKIEQIRDIADIVKKEIDSLKMEQTRDLTDIVEKEIDSLKNELTRNITDIVKKEIDLLKNELGDKQMNWFISILIVVIVVSFVCSFLTIYLKDGKLSPEAVASVVNGMATLIDKGYPK